jgi:hypothetical protein
VQLGKSYLKQLLPFLSLCCNLSYPLIVYGIAFV